MSLFNSIFNVDKNDNVSVEGLNSELYSIYIYNLFKKNNKNIEGL